MNSFHVQTGRPHNHYEMLQIDFNQKSEPEAELQSTELLSFYWAHLVKDDPTTQFVLVGFYLFNFLFLQSIRF